MSTTMPHLRPRLRPTRASRSWAFLLATGLVVSATAQSPTDDRELPVRGLPGDDRLDIWSAESIRTRVLSDLQFERALEPAIPREDAKVMIDAAEMVERGESDPAIEALFRSRGESTGAKLDFYLGSLLSVAGRHEEATLILEEALEKSPRFRRAWMALGEARVRSGQHAPAADALARAYALGATDAATSGYLAFCLARSGDPASAEAAYRRAILLDPESDEWKQGLLQQFRGQRRNREVVAMLDRLVREQPDEPIWWLLEGDAHIGAGDPSSAAICFEVADSLGGSIPESLIQLGNIYVTQGLFDLASSRFLAVFEKFERPPVDPVFDAMDVMLRLGEADAVDRFVQGVRACCLGRLDDGQRGRLLRIDARVASLRGDRSREQSILEEVIDLDPADGETMILLGRFHARTATGLPEGLEWFARAAAVPGFEAKALVEKARSLVAARRFAEALEALEAAQGIEDRPAVAEYLRKIREYTDRSRRK